MNQQKDVEHRAETMANEVENILLKGLSGRDDKDQTPHTRFSDYDYDPVSRRTIHGREAQKRDGPRPRLPRVSQRLIILQ